MQSFSEILRYAKQLEPKRLVVACAQDDDVLKAVEEARKIGIIIPILVGDEEKIQNIAQHLGLPLEHYTLIDTVDVTEAARTAAQLISEKKADILMKGLVDTSIVLKAVLDKSLNLRTNRRISHCAVFEAERYNRLMFITDAAMNIAPDLETKAAIIRNAVLLAHALNIDCPNVGVICAKEKVDPKMPATLDAQALVKQYEQKQLVGCTVGGPFALDNAISIEAAQHKGIQSPVAGNCDILLMPNIEAGNVLYKSIAFFSDQKLAGIILGAAMPIVLTSRADSDVTKLYSIALSVLYADKHVQ